ncbi:hypothetical protein ABPG72_000278 [Tetrahymena utriculariae]
MNKLQLGTMQILFLAFLGAHFVSCQFSQVQILPSGVGYLTLYNNLIQSCLITPSLCNQYDANDVVCMTGVGYFQNCLATKCYPAQSYQNSPLYQDTYINFSLFMDNCVQVCYGNTFNESTDPTSPSLLMSLKILTDCYLENKKDDYTPDYYKFYFLTNWQKCSIQNPQCFTDQSFQKYNDQIEKYVETCVQETPIYITNTAYVQDIALNQTSTCLINAFQSYQIDYQSNSCFKYLQQCGNFQILQKVSSALIQACLYGILIDFLIF